MLISKRHVCLPTHTGIFSYEYESSSTEAFFRISQTVRDLYNLQKLRVKMPSYLSTLPRQHFSLFVSDTMVSRWNMTLLLPYKQNTSDFTLLHLRPSPIALLSFYRSVCLSLSLLHCITLWIIKLCLSLQGNPSLIRSISHLNCFTAPSPPAPTLTMLPRDGQKITHIMDTHTCTFYTL